MKMKSLCKNPKIKIFIDCSQQTTAVGCGGVGRLGKNPDGPKISKTGCEPQPVTCAVDLAA
eukprot:COSAG05_NODE_787_length_7335_cov_30.078220_7_plen_60_part_01